MRRPSKVALVRAIAMRWKRCSSACSRATRAASGATLAT
jgi:hypothetical protein